MAARALHVSALQDSNAALAAATAASTSDAVDSATLPMTAEVEGLMTSRYSFDDGGTTEKKWWK